MLSEGNWLRLKADGTEYAPSEQAVAHQRYHELMERVRAYRRQLVDRNDDRPLSATLHVRSGCID